MSHGRQSEPSSTVVFGTGRDRHACVADAVEALDFVPRRLAAPKLTPTREKSVVAVPLGV